MKTSKSPVQSILFPDPMRNLSKYLVYPTFWASKYHFQVHIREAVVDKIVPKNHRFFKNRGIFEDYSRNFCF